ncbi:MAG: class I SAM-dependent methyltransferase, partial [Anaerolineae bacterium]
MINPQDIIEKYTVEELNETAEKYFSAIEDPTYLLAKPLNNFIETPKLLENVGLLLAGTKLTKSMTVLDFASGTCWLSYFLNQLQCKTISCDVSQTALDIGKRYFEFYPLVNPPVAEPQFLLFDGVTIDLPDNSVDRIICNDGFHHIPNQKVVLAEFSRILRDGGIVGFSEPGRYHSQTPQSQHEMQHYTVLENDILLNDVYEIAQSVGFTNIVIKMVGDLDFSLREYNFFTHPRMIKLASRFFPRIVGPLLNKSIFFLSKGEMVHDSRGHIGLSHEMTAEKSAYSAKVDEVISIPLTIKNTGHSIWLNENYVDIGIVKIGSHLLAESGEFLKMDFTRDVISRTVRPGETLQQSVQVSFPEKGVYSLSLDLLSEQVVWFGLTGSKTAVVT